jgi:hypothetical protein
MAGEFFGGILVGKPDELTERQRATRPGRIAVPSSGVPRGLALRSLVVSGSWDRLWNLLGRRQSIYFLSIAFDLSASKPIVLPPKEVPEGAVFRVRHGETIAFSLGAGAPVFPPRSITGGLIIYITVCEADRGTRHVGQLMANMHDKLANHNRLGERIKILIESPA